MQIKPHTTLLFLLSVFTVLLFASVIMPEKGIQLSEDTRIKFFNAREFFTSSEEYADISNIIEQNQFIADSLIAEVEIVLPEEVLDTIRANADSLKESISRLEFPENNKKILYPVFKSFETARASNKVVRVMHYGDSQIEGDRITSFIRNRLQSKFGGSGVGLVPARQLYDFRFSTLQESSSNWNRYTLYGKRDTLIKHKRYGILAGFNTYTRQPHDTALLSGGKRTAWVSFDKSPYSYSNTKKFNQCRLFYGHNLDTFSLNLIVNDEIVDSGTYTPANELKQVQWLFNEAVDNAHLEFKSRVSPEIYGIALDAQSGVAVDNIAMRGCAGLVFTKMDTTIFKSLVERLDVKLMILQFGGNVVPNIRKNYDYYERWFYSQLSYIRKYAPEVEIIVIGLSDMSRKEGNKYVSYPNIELVRDALKKATFRADAIYWDMYKAMGGHNSMPSWVFANPSLATKDFVHFTPRGAKIIANMFYNALMYEYALYVKQKPKSATTE